VYSFVLSPSFSAVMVHHVDCSTLPHTLTWGTEVARVHARDYERTVDAAITDLALDSGDSVRLHSCVQKEIAAHD
jgi:hypothetical protein